MGGHKRRIHLYISFDGIKIQDALTSEEIFHHTVPQISFISRDETDTRAFGYVFGNSATGHQFIGIKTKKEAMVVMVRTREWIWVSDYGIHLGEGTFESFLKTL